MTREPSSAGRFVSKLLEINLKMRVYLDLDGVSSSSFWLTSNSVPPTAVTLAVMINLNSDHEHARSDSQWTRSGKRWIERLAWGKGGYTPSSENIGLHDQRDATSRQLRVRITKGAVHRLEK
jgi:hypothetical protein